MIHALIANHLGDIAMVGLVLVGCGWLFHAGRRLIDLAIDAMRDWWHRHHGAPEFEYADFDREPVRGLDQHYDDARQLVDKDIAPEDEPSWPGKAPLLAPGTPAPEPERFDLTTVLPTSGSLAETESETSGRHARVEADDNPTGLMVPVGDVPAVDGEAALEAVAAVSAPDGVS